MVEPYLLLPQVLRADLSRTRMTNENKDSRWWWSVQMRQTAVPASVFPVRQDPWLRHGISPVGVGRQRRGRILRQFRDPGRELVFAPEHLLEGDLTSRVGGHAPHVADKAGLDAALGFV